MENKIETSFKITRFPATAMVCDYLVEIAAKSNGMPVGERITLAEMIAYAKCEILKSGHDGYTITPINEFHLLIDRRQQPALEIIEVEVFDIPDNPLEDYGHSAN